MSDIELKVVGAIAVAMVSACVGLFVRMRRAESVQGRLEERIVNLEKRPSGAGDLPERVGKVETGLAEVTATLKALPSAREFASVGQCVTAVQGDVKAVKATVDGMDKMIAGLSKQVGTLNQHLLGGGQ